MLQTSVVHCYVDQLISNDDGRFDTFGSSWFTVTTDWLTEKVLSAGFKSLEDFYCTYTYDDSEGLFQLAVDEGVLLSCGTGLLGNMNDNPIKENTVFSLNEYLRELIKEHYPAISDEQLTLSIQGVRHWFDVTVLDSIDDSFDD